MIKKRIKTFLRWARQRGVPPADLKNARPPASLPASGPNWAKVGILAFTIAALSALMSVHLMPDRVTLGLGEASPREVRAGRSVVYANTQATERLRQIAARDVRPIYETDDTAAARTQQDLAALFARIEAVRAGANRRATPARNPAAPGASSALDLPFSAPQQQRLASMPAAHFQKLRGRAVRLIGEAADRDIRDKDAESKFSEDLARVRRDVADDARELLPPLDAAIVRRLAEQTLRPNRLLDDRRTETARRLAAHSVSPVYERIARGDRVLGAGETVTQDTLDRLTALGMQNPHLDWTTETAICILAACMVLLVATYIARTLPALYADPRRLALLSLIVILGVVGLKVGSTMLGLSFSVWQLGYLGMMSVTAAGMLVSVLLDMHLAVLIVALLAVQSGLIMNHEIRFTVMTLMSSLVGIASAASARRRTNLLGVMLSLAVANLALVWLLGLLLRDSTGELLTGSAWAIGAAAFATFLFWFGVLTMEKPFGILTHTTLLEMSAFDQPLLKQLCAAAPGTYAHSMMVGTLAEAGAQATGADALLARVGGYYHDIGKMQRPDFFIENQRRENVHGRLSPSLSALFITAHVRDGIEMARQHRLPAEIRDIIAQHHGTTRIDYFYRQALTDCGGDSEAPPGLEARFRYVGPRPQTREAAIVMLADSVEAAARSLEKPNHEQLEARIASIVRGKIEDGQLDECDLTFRDTKAISDAFLHVLAAMMHGRIDYPQTATGQPMEVVRADLRPEPIPLSLPLAQAQRDVMPASPYTTDAEAVVGMDAESAREITARLNRDLNREMEPGETLGAVGALMESGLSDTPSSHLFANLAGPAENGNDLRTIAPPASAPPAVWEPEALYGSFTSERANAQGTDDRSATGGAASAGNRGAGPRGN